MENNSIIIKVKNKKLFGLIIMILRIEHKKLLEEVQMHWQLLEVYSQNVNDNLAFIYFKYFLLKNVKR
jgi:hypothetical protein